MKINYCRCARLISYCTAEEEETMKKCKYYDSSSFGRWCMYCDESITSYNGEACCKCADAQLEARKKYNEEKIKESEEGIIQT